MIRHVIITRFSVANLRSPVQKDFKYHDAQSPERLALRIRLFEMATFPSVAAQTDQDFDWVILVGAELPPAERAQLEAITSRRPRTHIVTYTEGEALWRTKWLSPWLSEGDSALATINLDDDDALPRPFIATLKRLTAAELSAMDKPGVRVFGYISPLQWDLRFSVGAPFGTVSPWHRILRGRRYASSCGLTAFVSNRQFNLSVLGLSHTEVIDMFNPAKQFEITYQINMQRLLRACAEASGDDWNAWSPATHFKSLNDALPLPVMLNHDFNEQRTRLAEPKAVNAAVTGPESFPDIALDWDAVGRFVEFAQSAHAG